MKKNIMMRLAAFLLVAVLLSTSIIGGTWAKYTTTSGDKVASASVAKWGVTITADVADNKEYQAVALSTEESAVLKTDAKLLAPGSGVKFGTFTITGTPEVAVAVTYTATINFGDGWKIGDPKTEYMPLVFTVGATTLQIGQDETISAFAGRIEAAIEAYSAEFNAGTNLADTNGATDGANQLDLAVSCYWAFDGDDTSDTALGDLNTAPTVTVTISCTVSQLDTH